MQNREKKIADKAVKLLEEVTGFETTLHFYERRDKPVAILMINNEDYQIEFNVEVKLFLNRARLGMIVNQIKGMTGIPLLITEYINPVLMETIETYGINFIDAAGNALIKVPPLFIKIKGNKLDKENKIKATQRTFNAAALQTIFALLCNPGIERNPIREIVKNAETTIGTVHRTLKELERQGYLQKGLNQNSKIINKEDLLERWVTLYPERLKLKYLLGKYEMDEDLIRNLDLEPYGALLGGEPAAAKLTNNYIQPFFYTIYLGEKQGEFILRNRLRKHPQGNLALMKKFWNFENYDYPGMTHPILVYADLLATGDPRNIEAANIIFEKDIVRYIR
jgi:hypothetical protein